MIREGELIQRPGNRRPAAFMIEMAVLLLAAAIPPVPARCPIRFCKESPFFYFLGESGSVTDR